jgi:hypothetical protein
VPPVFARPFAGYPTLMELYQLILLGAVVALVVAAIAWFGPRSSQWRTHDGHPTETATPAPGSKHSPGSTEGRDRGA